MEIWFRMTPRSGVTLVIESPDASVSAVGREIVESIWCISPKSSFQFAGKGTYRARNAISYYGKQPGVDSTCCGVLKDLTRQYVTSPQ